jgi:hypothetical protein
MSKVLVDREGLAHELWAAAQLAPGEGISNGVARLASLLAQPAEAEGVDFGFDDRSVKVSQEAYSIFLERERHNLATLAAVTAERDRLRPIHAMILNALDRDAEEGKTARGEMAAELRAALAAKEAWR